MGHKEENSSYAFHIYAEAKQKQSMISQMPHITLYFSAKSSNVL